MHTWTDCILKNAGYINSIWTALIVSLVFPGKWVKSSESYAELTSISSADTKVGKT